MTLESVGSGTINPAGRAWKLLILALLLAMAGSAWAWFAGAGCGSCTVASHTFQGRSMAAAGLFTYAFLLLAALTAGPSQFLHAGTFLAAGVHAGLIAILIRLGIFCAPCVFTSLAALGALVSSLAFEPSQAYRAGVLTPVAAGVVQAAALFSGELSVVASPPERAERIVEPDLLVAPALRGTVRMVIYTRPDCGYCQELERDVLPVLVGQFGSRVAIERRSARDLPGIPTPTIILSGADGRRLFPGLPPTEDLRRSIETLMGGSHGP